MITTRYIDVAFGGARSAMARALFQYDYGQILRITDLALPFAYEVHFSDTKTGNSVTMIGNADGVEIPDACLLTSGNVYCWFYLHDTESDGETRYEVLIPILSRAKPTNAAPTPVQQDVIDQAIAALDAAVQQTGEDVIAAGASASAAAGSASDAEAWAVGERDGEPVESTDPTYHNNSKYYAGEAASAAQTASQDAQTASDAAIAAGNAKTAAETAQGKAETAQEKAEAAQTAAEDAADQTALDVIAAADSADEASGYANTASGYASTASGYATAAKGHAQDASGYASSASGYATNAYNSATAAAGSAGEASGYASSASGYASAANDAKLAAQGAQTSAETAQGLAEAAQTGAEAAQTAAETARDAAIAATEDKAPVILDSASGAIVSIVDGAQGMNARSLVAAFSPIQDLHGYDSPWPAGGNYNKLSAASAFTQTDNGITLKSDGTGVYTLSGTATADFSYKFNIPEIIMPSTVYVHIMNSAGASTNSAINLDFYNGATRDDFAGFGVTANRKYNGTTELGGKSINALQIRVANGEAISGTLTFSPMVLLSNDTVPFVPYSNICPISGRTGLTAYRSGANLWDNALYTSGENPLALITDTSDPFYGYYGGSIASWAASRTVYLNANQITVTADYGADGGSFTFRVYFGYDDGTSDYNGGNIALTDGDKLTVTRTSASGKRCVSYSISTSAGTGNTRGRIKNVMVSVVGDTQYAYPVRALYPVSWQSEAGTVYGGTVDVVTGVLTVTHGTTNMGNFTYISEDSAVAGLFRVATFELTPLGMKYAKVQSSILKGTEPRIYNLVEMESVCLSNSEASPFLRVRSASFVGKTADTVNSILSGQTLCYELKTPVTYQLTPTQIQMLLGANNVWSTGDTVDLTYPCDTRLYIERLTEPTEDDMVANANIPIDKFFMIGNSLYYSTAAIAQGAAIVVGTNCNAVSLADALNQLA